MLKIIHAPYNIANQSTIISREQRKLGYKSDVLIFNDTKYKYTHDFNLKIKGKHTIIRFVIRLLALNYCLFKYNIFHFHYNETFLPRNWDLPILKLFRKKMVVEFWGSDIRQYDIAKKYTDVAKENNLKEENKNMSIEKKRQWIEKISKYFQVFIIGDPSLFVYVSQYKSFISMKLLDLRKFKYIGTENKHKRVKIIHAPTNKEAKGTKYILEAIELLRREQFSFEFILVENKSHKELRHICESADIIIDQLLSETYGVFAMENMAIGKPVLCRIDEFFIKYYPNIPIVRSNPNNVYDNLVMLISNPKLRKELGKKGRKFVEKYHNSKIVATKLITLYKKL